MKGEDKMLRTEQNLMDAFAGESQANRKYLAFAKKAEEEGYSNVAKLFRAAAAAETIHAHNHLKGMNAVKSTKENLMAAISGESYEFQNMYPRMITDAKAEKQDYALRSFNLANEVEKVHAALYKRPEKPRHRHSHRLLRLLVCSYTAEGRPRQLSGLQNKGRHFTELNNA
jgi:rubrerythrin